LLKELGLLVCLTPLPAFFTGFFCGEQVKNIAPSYGGYYSRATMDASFEDHDAGYIST
jgi:hypothetical protein